VNKHLELVGVAVTDLRTDLSDGVNLILLVGVLGGLFVPLYNYHNPARSTEDKAGGGRRSPELPNQGPRADVVGRWPTWSWPFA
jgi:hypothetical protein